MLRVFGVQVVWCFDRVLMRNAYAFMSARGVVLVCEAA